MRCDFVGFPDMIMLVGISPVNRSRTRADEIGHDCRTGITPITDERSARFKRIMPIRLVGERRKCVGRKPYGYLRHEHWAWGSKESLRQDGTRIPSSSRYVSVYATEDD